MSKLSVYDVKGAPVGEIEVADDLLVRKGDQAVHDVIVAYQAGRRAGTASTLRKGEVAGSGKKPWKQKGTGRARAGYRQSPVWRGGSVAFGPHPRSYEKAIPKKVARLAFRRALSDKVVAGELKVVDQLAIEAPKTRQFMGLLKALGVAAPVLVVVEKPGRELLLAARNIPNVEVVAAATVSTYQLVRYPVAVVTRGAVEQLKTRLANGPGGAE